MSHPKKLVSILCPVFNEEDTIALFYERLQKVLESEASNYKFEIIFTNNGSTDKTKYIIDQIYKWDERIRLLTLSRNFGYQASLMAGIRNSHGDSVVVIDCDCEDPPEMIPQFLRGWEAGHDLVYGIRQRSADLLFLRVLRKAFYRVTRLIADYDFILDMAEFSLFTRRVKDAVLHSKSTFPFMRADLGFVGFKRLGIPYERQKRVAGTTHYNYVRMVQFACMGILSSTTFFLRLAVYIGFPLTALNMVMILGALLGNIPLKYLICLVSADLTFLIMATGFLSTYLSRIYKDGIQRPSFIIDWNNSIWPQSETLQYREPPLAIDPPLHPSH